MGSKYPVLTPDKIIKTLRKFGLDFVGQKGSHMKYSDGTHIVIMPNHAEVAKGTWKSILTMADIPLETFLKKL